MGHFKKNKRINRMNGGLRAQVKILNSDTSFLVDTFSPVNVIDKFTYDQFLHKPDLHLRNVKQYITGGTKKLKELKKKFPDLFSGKLGCLKGVEVKLDLVPTIKPIRQQQRPIAFHSRKP